MQDRITEGPHTSVGLEQYMLIVVECHSDSFPSMEATRRVTTLKTERTTFWEFGKEKRCLATARSRILYMFSVGSTPPSHVLSPRADRVVIVEITVNVYISVDIIRGHLWKRWRRLKTSW